MDLERILKRSRRFYREHNLPAWREAVPREGTLAPTSEAVAAQAEKLGFDFGWAFPRFALQMDSYEVLVEETARKHAPGLADNQQYQEPFLSDTWSREANGKIMQRRDDLWSRVEGPYVLLFARKPCASVWGRTGEQIAEHFAAKGWTSLTVPEYLVLQRYFCEKHGDHRFFAEPLDETGGHWLWLVDSQQDDEMTVAQGSPRGINLQAPKSNHRDSRRAALATLVVELQSV